MIRILAKQRPDGLDVIALGHAEGGERGTDVICAGVSALLFGYAAYLDTLVAGKRGDHNDDSANSRGSGDGDRSTDSSSINGSVERQVGDGYLRLCTHGFEGADMAAWTVTAAGLALIAAKYPDHVRSETGKERKTVC